MMDANGTTEFMWACSRGDHVLVKHMLKHEDVYLNHEDEFGNTALSLAVKHGHIKIVKLLLKFDLELLFMENNKDAFETLLNCDTFDMNIRDLELFQTRKQQETFLTSEYIQALRLPLMCKDLSGEIASYFSWDDVSPRKRAPVNVLRENEHLMAKYNMWLFGLEGGGAFEFKV